MSDENISGGAENASDPGADIKSTALGQMAKAESIENYAAERADQEAEAEGREPSTPPEERVNRYQQVLEQARQETDRARRENGLNSEQNGFDAQVEQAALAQEQEQALQAELDKREKYGADVALYTHKANQELDQHRLLGGRQSNLHGHSANNGNSGTNPLGRKRPRNRMANVPAPGRYFRAQRHAAQAGRADYCKAGRRHHG